MLVGLALIDRLYRKTNYSPTVTICLTRVDCPKNEGQILFIRWLIEITGEEYTMLPSKLARFSSLGRIPMLV